MSSGEESCRQSPVIPGESDRGSSVSSDLQEEYEELLRHAVVMPKWDATRPLPRQHVPSRTVATLTEDQTTPALAMEEATQGRQQHASSTSEKTAPGNDNVTSSVIRQEQRENGSEPRESAPVPVPLASQLLLQTLGRVSPESEETGGPTLLGQDSHLNQDEVRTQPLLPADKLERVGDILDTWYSNLKRNVLMELGQWMQSTQQEYKKEAREEQERHAAEVAQLHAQLGDLRQLLHTFDKSVKCKDQVISNLTNGLQKEKEKMEKLRAFTHWRLRHADEQQEVFCSRLARQHYHRALTKKVWAAWHSLVEIRWQQRVERACQARAQEVCIQVGNDYEARIIALNEALVEAQGKMAQLQGEREHYNEAMKKAFMRGVCALNLEAMSMFQDNERRLEAGVHTAPHFGPPDSGSAAGGGGPSDVQFSQQTDFSEGGGAALAENSCGREQMPPARVVGGAQQKAGRPASARPPSSFPAERLGRASRTAVEPAARFGRGMVGLAPPMSTVVIERHHPVTKQTVGHATAMRHPRSASVPVGAGASDGKAPGPGAKGGGAVSGGALSSSGAHTIRVVD
ncbi:centrosomal protein POC5 isoform X3 [Lethenteron reissneri]|uniref:centrosomal protein POC5 isoform X3 n=1 Tax=Lethenteron reissneri TaxID=7753 RepID=UPI002AB64652|nr:centrosomal protein POC5 isoform X3 [Lethenteron reissneri]